MGRRISSQFGVTPHIAAVIISNGNNITDAWNVVPISKGDFLADCPETSLIVEDKNILALTRQDKGLFPYIHQSGDYGKTWTAVENHTFPASPAKIYSGRLSTRQRYVIFNVAQTKSGDAGRCCLTIAVSKPGETALSQIYKVRDDSKWSCYPCAIEHEGKLYIVYTTQIEGRRHCGMSVIPIKSLL
jgi:hypothetical protein